MAAPAEHGQPLGGEFGAPRGGLRRHVLHPLPGQVTRPGLFAQFVRTRNSTGEVGARYRPAALASLCTTGVAFLAYVYPVVEFLAVSAPAGARARSTRFALMAAASLTIFTGYLGATVDGGGSGQTELLVRGVVSTVFHVALYVALYVLLLRVLLVQLVAPQVWNRHGWAVLPAAVGMLVGPPARVAYENAVRAGLRTTWTDRTGSPCPVSCTAPQVRTEGLLDLAAQLDRLPS